MITVLICSVVFISASDENSIPPALDDLDRAAKLNPKAALPKLFKAELLGNHLVFFKRVNQAGWKDETRDNLEQELVTEYTKALSADPKLVRALQRRALAYFHLKQCES